jgi:microcystin-dependent protein
MVHRDLPIGSVVAFAAPLSEQNVVTLAGQGWLVCDGRTLDAREYAELFGALQYVYGGTGDFFNLPALPSQKQGAGQLAQIIKAYSSSQ